MKKHINIICVFAILCYFPLSIYCYEKQLEDCKTYNDYLEFVLANAPSEDAFVAVQRLASPYIHDKDWYGAVKVFEKYKLSFPQMKKRFEKIIEILNADDDNLMINRLANINSDYYEEAFPVPSLDGKVLYFAGVKPYGIGSEDIYYSELINNEWQSPNLMPEGINSIQPETPKSISSDGNKLVVWGNYYDSYGRGDLWFVEKTDYGWSNRIHFPKPINSEYYDGDGSFTSDGNAFIFASDRPGAIGKYHEKGIEFHGWIAGNTDIWLCVKNENGWSEPINLGNSINTPYAERSPFLHPDGKTLFFVSDGHYGLGLCDVFMSRRLSNNSWTEWSEPINLGKSINSSQNDEWFIISTFGDSAYFSSYVYNDQIDIYSTNLPEWVKTESVTSISGKVVDENANPISNVKINWEDLETGELLNKDLKTNPQTGEYFIILPNGRKYTIFAEKSGYYPISDTINLSQIKGNQKMQKIITLISYHAIDSGYKITLNNIFFDFDSFDLKHESYSELNKVVDYLNDNPHRKIQIYAHTDSVNTKDYNMKLSRNRAKSVKEHLLRMGIDEKRLLIKACGETKPIASNSTEEGRKINRRVEFEIINIIH